MGLPILGFSSDVVHCPFQLFQIQIGLVILLIANPPLDIWFILPIIQLPRLQRSKTPCPNPPLNPSTGFLQLLQLSCVGFVKF